MTPDQLVASVVEVSHIQTGITTGRMFRVPVLTVGGTVFTMLVNGTLVVNVPSACAAAIVASSRGAYVDPGHGRISQAWVAVLPGTATEWRNLAEEARAFVAANR